MATRNTREGQVPRRQPESSPKRNKRRRKGRRTLHHLLLLLLLVAVGVVLSLTVFFKIEEIRVDNIDEYTDEEIIAASGLELDTNLILTSVREIPTTLKEAFPYIEEVEVKKTLPPAVEIKIYPSMPAAVLQQGEEFALITLSGKVLERGLVFLPADVILVRGVDFSNRQPGDYLGVYTPEPIPEDATEAVTAAINEENKKRVLQAEEEQNALYAISYMLDAIDETEIEGITNLDLTDPYNMTVVYENRLLLKLGTELGLSYKLRFVDEAIRRLDPRAHGTLHAENAVKSGSKKNRIVYSPAEGYHNSGVPLASFEEEQKQQEQGEELEELEDPLDTDGSILVEESPSLLDPEDPSPEEAENKDDSEESHS